MSKVRQLLDNFLGDQAEVVLEQARQHLAQGQLLSALELLREALELAPRSVDVLLELGRLQVRLGHAGEAWALLQQALELGPERAEVHLAVVDLVLREDVDAVQLEDLAQRLTLLRAQHPDDPDLIRRQARLAARLERPDQAIAHYREALALAASDETLLLELGDLQRDHGHLDQALGWYRQVDAEGPFGDAARERMWRVEVELQARRFGLSTGGSAPDDAAAALVERARTLLERKRPREATPLLQQALAMAPGYSEARLLLGDAWRVQGERQRAELDYLRGLVFDQASAELHARLGELYLEHVDDNRVQEAIALLGRALQLRPDWLELKLKLAQSLRRSGQLPRALRLVQEYLVAQPAEPGHTQALALQASLEKSLMESGWLAASSGAGDNPTGEIASGSTERLQGLNRARALLERGQTAEALASLSQLVGFGADARLLALQGRILHAAGQLEQAQAVLEDSLRLEPQQPELRTQRGAILLALGEWEQARMELEQAHQLGDREASIYLAELSLQRARRASPWLVWLELPDLLGARSRLAQDAQHSDIPAISLRRARQREALARAAWGAALLPLALFTLVLAGLAWSLRRRLGGVDLAQLLERAPELGTQVQRILASIHHEVLKHNTMILGGVVDALRQGHETEQQLQRLQHLASADADAPSTRFRSHVPQLEDLASSVGLHLNLRFKDSAIRPIFKGFSILHQCRGLLSVGTLRQVSARQRLRTQLERASALLNTEAYLRMKALIDSIRVEPIDEAWLRQVFERAAEEQGVPLGPRAELRLSSDLGWPLRLAIPRDSLADILTNLFRNAIEASVKQGLSACLIGLHLSREQHAITGYSRLAVAVRDRASASFTVQQARDRPRHRGLGLVQDLLQKHEGGLCVRPLQGDWSKEVVAFLPLSDV